MLNATLYILKYLNAVYYESNFTNLIKQELTLGTNNFRSTALRLFSTFADEISP